MKKEFGVKKIGIFSSYAKGYHKRNSDIDIIVEFDRQIGFAFMDLIDYLEKLFDNKIDTLTPEGVKSIRIKGIAEDIEKSVIYV